MKRQLAKMGSRFAFEFFLETMHQSILRGVRKYLSDISPEKLRSMILEHRFPKVKHLDFSMIGDNTEHLEKISATRIMEFLAEARRDLAAVIMESGPQGALYLVDMRRHFLDLIKNPEKDLAKSTEYTAKSDMVQATCDKCEKSWPVERDKSSTLDKCPFCGE